MTEDPPERFEKFDPFRRDGEWWASDEHGEFRLEAGRPDKPPWDDLEYDRCGAVLKFTYKRYGEKRYCTALAVQCFSRSKYEYPEFCKHHQNRRVLMDHAEERYKTGAFVASYKNIYQFLSAHKQIVAIDLYRSLLEQSVHQFDETEVDFSIDASDSEVFDVDEIPVAFPIPEEKTIQAKALWFASLDFIRMQDIHEEQFRVAAEETEPKSGRPLAIGEKAFEKETESGEKVTIVDEHHLNLPLSRIQKDYERHLKFGGIELDQTGEESAPMSEREWVLEIHPDPDEGMEPEAVREVAPIDEIEPPEYEDDE